MRRRAARWHRKVCAWLGHWPDVWQPRCVHCHVSLPDTDEHPTLPRRLFWRRSLAPSAPTPRSSL